MTDALDSLYAVAVHPSGSHIAAAGADRMIRTWSWNATPRRPAEIRGRSRRSTFAHADAVLRLAYSPDGATLVSAGADRVIKVWDARTLRETQRLEAQPDWIMGLALSADGKWLARRPLRRHARPLCACPPTASGRTVRGATLTGRG